MKATIIIAAILDLLGAVLFTLGGLSAIFFPPMQTAYNNMHPWMGWIVGGCFILAGLVFLWTAIGLFMRKDFARLTMRLLGIFLLVYGVVIGVSGSIGVLSTATQSSPSLVAMIIILGFASVQMSLGLWWTLCFRKSKMAQLFPTTGIAARRPDSVSVIALLNMGGIVMLPAVTMITAFPALGVVLEGWTAQAFWVVWMLVLTVLGIGLWRLQEWARIGTLALFGFGMLNALVTQLVPGAHDRYMSVVMAQFGSTKPVPATSGGGWVAIVVCGIFFGIQAYFLITRRGVFRKVD